MSEEVWKDVVGYEGLYQVSNFGRIKSLRKRRHENGIMVLGEKNGYPCIMLRVDKKRYFKLVHRLVAEAFIPKVEGKLCIDHIDGNTRNNNVSNLRWCTTKENSNFPLAIQHKREAMSGEKNPFFGKKHSSETKAKISNSRMGKYYGDKNPFFGKKHTEESRKKISEQRKLRGGKPIVQYTTDGLFLKIWNHAKEAGVSLKISPSSITECCKHKRKTIGGYCWEYYK